MVVRFHSVVFLVVSPGFSLVVRTKFGKNSWQNAVMVFLKMTKFWVLWRHWTYRRTGKLSSLVFC